MNAIPTMYKGRLYRSRLEARWACMFDNCDWRYEYEPFDMNGWIPDFALIGKNASTLVEVKPVSHFIPAFFDEIKTKVRRSGYADELLLLGATWPDPQAESEETHPVDRYIPFGWLLEADRGVWGGSGNTWSHVVFNLADGAADVGFIPTGYTSDWTDRINGTHNKFYDVVTAEHRSAIQEIWQNTGNVVQWKPPYYQAPA